MVKYLMPNCNDDNFCRILDVKSKAYTLIIFIGLALILEFIVHYIYNISIIYTHLFYLIIIFAAIWYQRKAVWVAIFFGILHIIVSYIIQDYIPFEAVFRAIMLCIIAYIVGSVVYCMACYRDEQVTQNLELIKTQHAFEIANKKLNLLSSITRHDILNQLTILEGYLEILEDISVEPKLLEFIRKEQQAANTIRRQIEFTKNYQDIGVKNPIWHNLSDIYKNIVSNFPYDTIKLNAILGNFEIYADPLFPIICQNLIDNSVRHGDHVSTICILTERADNSLLLIYMDNGIGVPDHEKDVIFNRGYGKHTGMGLFLSQEILAITGLSMQEKGNYGSGVRFEIMVPDGSFRISSQDTTDS